MGARKKRSRSRRRKTTARTPSVLSAHRCSIMDLARLARPMLMWWVFLLFFPSIVGYAHAMDEEDWTFAIADSPIRQAAFAGVTAAAFVGAHTVAAVARVAEETVAGQVLVAGAAAAAIVQAVHGRRKRKSREDELLDEEQLQLMQHLECDTAWGKYSGCGIPKCGCGGNCRRVNNSAKIKEAREKWHSKGMPLKRFTNFVFDALRSAAPGAWTAAAAAAASFEFAICDTPVDDPAQQWKSMHFSGIGICVGMWLAIYGAKMDTVRKMVLALKRGVTGWSVGKLRKVGNERKGDISQRRLLAQTWVEEVIVEIAEPMPNDTNPDRKQLDGYTAPQLHCEYLVDFNDKYGWDADAKKPFNTVSLPVFKTMLEEDVSYLALRAKKDVSGICDTCAKLNLKLQAATTPSQRMAVARERRAHSAFVRKERKIRMQINIKVLEQYKDGNNNSHVIMMDGMDQFKTCVPNLGAFKSKVSGECPKMKHKVMGTIVTGICMVFYVLLPFMKSNANLTVTCLNEIMHELPETDGTGDLYCMIDGASDNWNKELRAFGAQVTAGGRYKNIFLHRLPVGHTHDYIDERFQKLACALMGWKRGKVIVKDGKVAWTFEDLKEIGDTCGFQQRKEKWQGMKRLDQSFDATQFYEGRHYPVTGLGPLLDTGIPMWKYKEYASDDGEWYPAGLPGLPIFNEKGAPSGTPNFAEYQDLEKFDPSTAVGDIVKYIETNGDLVDPFDEGAAATRKISNWKENLKTMKSTPGEALDQFKIKTWTGGNVYEHHAPPAAAEQATAAAVPDGSNRLKKRKEAVVSASTKARDAQAKLGAYAVPLDDSTTNTEYMMISSEVDYEYPWWLGTIKSETSTHFTVKWWDNGSKTTDTDDIKTYKGVYTPSIEAGRGRKRYTGTMAKKNLLLVKPRYTGKSTAKKKTLTTECIKALISVMGKT